jgi:hypothetical protein
MSWTLLEARSQVTAGSSSQGIENIRFVDWPASCVNLPIWCSVAQPSSWSESERQQVKELILRLASVDRIRPIIEGLVNSQYGVFVKFKIGFTVENGRLGPPRSSNLAWIDHNRPGLNLSQVFLDANFGTDPSGFEVKSKLLLHEAFHVIDRRDMLSVDPGFVKARVAALSGVDVTACRRIRASLLNAYEKGMFVDGWRQMRSTMRNTTALSNLPSPVVCGEGDAEAFAEFASFWFVDPEAKNYYPREMAAWLTQTFP